MRVKMIPAQINRERPVVGLDQDRSTARIAKASVVEFDLEDDMEVFF